MRFVSIKTVEQADLQAVHRTRSLFVKHRTAVINQIRGLLAEYGLVIGQSPEKVRPALVRFLDDAASGLTAFARDTFAELYAQLTELDARIERVTHRVECLFRAYPVCQKLAAVPGIGPMTATALVATVGRPQAFHNGRHLAAWLGLVPAIFQWRQGALRRDVETRQSVCADAADSWGARRRAAGRAADRSAGAVAVRTQTPQRHSCGRGRLSQQKCPGDLGLVGP
jgi:transposase